MQALGLIETRGLIASVEAADVMVKSADVSIVEKTYVGGGLVTILVTGDVGAVKASVDAGVSAVKKLGEQFLVSEHVIARPHEEVEKIIGPNNPNPPENVEELLSDKDEVVETTENVEESNNLEVSMDTEVIDNPDDSQELQQELQDVDNKFNVQQSKQSALDLDIDKLHKSKLENLHKVDVDNVVKENGLEKAVSILSNLKVVKLRNLAREYDDFGIKGRAISKAGKKLLISKFKVYYEKN